VGYKDGDNPVVRALNERITKLESSLESLLKINAAQEKLIESLAKKSEILIAMHVANGEMCQLETRKNSQSSK